MRDHLPHLEDALISHPFIDSTVLHVKDMQYTKDIEIHLLGGTSFANRIVLSNRSKFFRALVNPLSPWKLVKINGKHQINLGHIPLSIFNIISDWMYTNDSTALFDRVFAGSKTEFIQLLFDLVSFCDELLFDPLIRITGEALIPLLTVQNATTFLELGILYKITVLIDAALLMSQHLHDYFNFSLLEH